MADERTNSPASTVDKVLQWTGSEVQTIAGTSIPELAPIERGSNSNGEWVRFPDGTQICQRTVSPYSFNDDETYLFPQEFSAVPAGFLTGSFSNSASIRNIARVGIGCSTASWRVRTISGIEAASVTVVFTAIGRWK